MSFPVPHPGLGLDWERSWIIVSESNVFAWPGSDPRPPTGHGAEGIAFGMLPPTFFRIVRDAFLKLERGASGYSRAPHRIEVKSGLVQGIKTGMQCRYLDDLISVFSEVEIMGQEASPVEVIRISYRPKRITTLFVGESAPASGAFFYCGNTGLARQMESALEAAGLRGEDPFLERFKGYGWYLDDLVLTPVNHLEPSQRKQLCREAKDDFARRIAEYQPLAIVSLLIRIKGLVKAAADAAGSTAPFFAVPFPLQGHQPRFQKAMAHILPQLPKESQ